MTVVDYPVLLTEGAETPEAWAARVLEAHPELATHVLENAEAFRDYLTAGDQYEALERLDALVEA